ncbi:Uncharacterised protein [Mycobacteroides abscessus subsp. abscessus]|nr:Uncharacterised protein [Mycobacteroides abscessus subsp. abscessus]
MTTARRTQGCEVSAFSISSGAILRPRIFN